MPEFEKLAAWQKAHQLALDAYRLTKNFPRDERFALTDQIRRCAASIPTNVAEGHGRLSDNEFAYFLRVALGSAAELQSLMLLARDLGYVSGETLCDFWPQVAETIRMLKGLLHRVEEDIDNAGG
ncbi:MAG: four helix bundle protein [Armatimonadota bacterium]